MVSNSDQQEPQRRIFVSVHIETGGDLRQPRPLEELGIVLRIECLNVDRYVEQVEHIREELEENGSQFTRKLLPEWSFS